MYKMVIFIVSIALIGLLSMGCAVSNPNKKNQKIETDDLVPRWKKC